MGRAPRHRVHHRQPVPGVVPARAVEALGVDGLVVAQPGVHATLGEAPRVGRSQARVVVLMGEAKKFRAGEMVVRTGDPAEEMYVILDGDAEVWAGEGRGRRVLTALKRGDVFGEMGFVRRSERTADVVAKTDVEVLAVDQRFLDRVQRRYPRIASKVFLNLTRVLSNSLERTTRWPTRSRCAGPARR